MQAKRLIALAAIAAAAVAVPSAQAHHADGGSGWQTVASGLDNPRGIDVASNGDIWIAEAGRGGAGPCFPGNEGPTPSCFGNSGAFTVVHDGVQRRVVTGLPSLADQGTGDNAVGTSDILADQSRPIGLIGGGGNPTDRSAVGDAGALAGWMVKINPRSGKLTPIADLLQYEADKNPDGGAIDSDIYGLARRYASVIVADAAGNDVLKVNHNAQISTFGVLPDVQVAAPPFLNLPPGTMIPMQAVPTSVAVRRGDPNVYAGQLTGFPFPMGAANVFGIRPDGSKFVYASGFTNIVDIAWGPNGSLYVLEITSAGLTSGDPTGALIRVEADGDKEVVASTGLVTPTAVAISDDGWLYVSNYGTSAGKGTVVRIGRA
jgi:hypothetical protein